MAPYKIIKQGYMLKEPPPSRRGLRKKLRRYWFVLLEDKKQVAFVYYKNEDAYIERQRNIGFIRMNDSAVNVIGEYMGFKNAFSVITEQAKYILVPESRYELHDWIFVLHNALEGFHRRMERVQTRQEQRQRALSASSAASSTVHGSSTPTTPTQASQPSPTPPTRHAHHSPTMPTRPAPQIPPQHAASSTSTVSTPGSSGQSQGSSSDGSRRRPKRPAPTAPKKKTGQSSPSQSGSSNPTPNHTPRFHRQQSHEVPVFASLSQTSTSPYSTLESGQHPVMDLVIAQIEESQREGQREGEGEGEEDHEGREREQEWGGEEEGEERRVQLPQEGEGGGLAEAPPPAHARSESDSHLILTRKNSSSLPDLVKRDNSVSPEDEDASTAVPDNIEDARKQISSESPVPHRSQHTRHLSLTGVNISGKLRKKRRQQSASLKQRSRSPPNYPPPPPPADEDSGNEAFGGRKGEGEAPLAGGEEEATRKGSLGFSQVMSTMSNVSHEVEEMASEVVEPPPNISPPLRFRAINPSQSPVQEYPVEEEEEARRAGLLSPPVAIQSAGIEIPPLEVGEMGHEEAQMQFREEEEEEEEDEEAGKESERELIEKNLSPTHLEEKEVTARIFFPETQEEGSGTATGQVAEEEEGGDTRGGSEPQPAGHHSAAPPPVLTKPKPKKNRVMFKEEVEDIPSYEPRIDEEMASSGDEGIPSTVAELKMMLFGQKETRRYTKEGPMSLRYGAIVDTEDYDPNLHAMLSPEHHDTVASPQHHEGSASPQNQEAGSPSSGLRKWQFVPLSPPGGEGERKSSSLSPQDDGVGPEPQKISDMGLENEYDTPWDHKPISKYSVVGHRKRLVAPPQTKPQQDRVEFEVTSHNTAVPGSTERRNVHSLERQKVRVRGSTSPQGVATSPTQLQQQKQMSPPRHEAWGGSLERGTRHVSPSQSLQPPATDSDLLQDISSTLQSRSKYGSDSFLNMGKQSLSQGDSPINYPAGEQVQRGGEVRRSARAELERIRTEHRREAPQRHSLVSPISGQNGNVPHSTKMLSRSHQAIDGGRPRGGGGGGRFKMRSGFSAQKNTRMTQSVDGLQSDASTHVMYDQYTNSHTFRSLV